MSDCTICQTEQHGARHGHTACQPCEDWTRDQLNAIEHLWQDLPEHLGPGASSGGPRVSGGSVEAPLPVSEAVLTLLAVGGVPDRLAPHDEAIRTARGFSGARHPGTADVRLGATVKSLRQNLPWAAQHVELYDLAVALRDLVGEMRAATKQRAETKSLGRPCPECSGGLRYNRDTGAIRCDECGQPVDPAAFTARAA